MVRKLDLALSVSVNQLLDRGSGITVKAMEELSRGFGMC
jgi:hypothetical protein